jgi:hypothetical protein
MKSLNSILLSATLLLFVINSFGQKNCEFKIDTAKILANKNLDGFINKLQSDTFKIANNKKDIPSFIKKQLNCYTGKFSIANPDGFYQEFDLIINKSLPRRKITFLAKSKDMLVLAYLHGGSGVTRHILFIQFKEKKIIDLWCGVSLDDICSKEKLIEYVEKNKNKIWGLNTNCIYL